MSHRLQVLLDEDEIARLRAAARRHRVTISEYVRRAIREVTAREPATDTAHKLLVVREAASHAYPTAELEQMEAEIARGYVDDA